MNWQSVLALVALVGIALVAAGATIRLGATIGAAGVAATVLLVGVLVVAVVALTLASLRRSSTPYW